MDSTEICEDCGCPEPHCQCDIDYDTDDEWDEFEEAIQNCGQLHPRYGGGCMLAATEYCDFECSFRDELYKP